MKPFHYYEPVTVQEVCLLLARLGKTAKLLAGGTDLVVKMKIGAVAPDHVINIKKIPILNEISEHDEGLQLGSAVRLCEIVDQPVINRRLPILSNAAKTIGSFQVRNIATIGGNVCNAAPSADMVPGLLALDAQVILQNPEGSRTCFLEKLLVGPGNLELRDAEMLVKIVVPFPEENSRQIYIKYGPRRAMDCAIVGVAMVISVDDTSETIERANIALGAIAPTAIRARRLEQQIVGRTKTEISFDSVAECIYRECSPITDVRATAEYRAEMAATLTIRAIQYLLS